MGSFPYFLKNLQGFFNFKPPRTILWQVCRDRGSIIPPPVKNCTSSSRSGLASRHVLLACTGDVGSQPRASTRPQKPRQPRPRCSLWRPVKSEGRCRAPFRRGVQLDLCRQPNIRPNERRLGRSADEFLWQGRSGPAGAQRPRIADADALPVGQGLR